MPSFTCAVCGREWSIAEADLKRFESNHFECNICYSVIAKQRYEKNIKGAEVLFSPMGNALGDRIMSEVIRRKYKEDNPDEIVYFPQNAIEAYDLRRAKTFKKVFWADVAVPIESGMQREFLLPPDGAKWFSVSSEASEYARQGIYPELTFKPTKPGIKIPKDYAVLHFRNIGTHDDRSKNTPEILAKRLLDLTKHIFNYILIVGNDKKYEYMEDEIDAEKVIDLRGSLAIPRLAWVLREASLYIGPDSGVAHLAAASGCRNIISWNYVNENWFPKCPPERLTAFTREPNVWEKLKEAISGKR
jgi:hypothetical protein